MSNKFSRNKIYPIFIVIAIALLILTQTYVTTVYHKNIQNEQAETIKTQQERIRDQYYEIIADNNKKLALSIMYLDDRKNTAYLVYLVGNEDNKYVKPRSTDFKYDKEDYDRLMKVLEGSERDRALAEYIVREHIDNSKGNLEIPDSLTLNQIYNNLSAKKESKNTPQSPAAKPDSIKNDKPN